MGIMGLFLIMGSAGTSYHQPYEESRGLFLASCMLKARGPWGALGLRFFEVGLGGLGLVGNPNSALRKYASRED